jgi:hypothetical protein
MALFGRDKLAQYGAEIAAYAKAIDNIADLQASQREMVDSIRRIGDRVHALEVEFRALKAEVKAETLRETVSIVNAVQGQFNKDLRDVTVDIAILREQTRGAIDSAPRLSAARRDDDGAPKIAAP